jgi:hypothetical protein
MIAFAFFLDGGVPKSAYRRTQTFDRLVPNSERFRESVFQYSPSASNVFWAGAGISVLPRSERRARIRWRALQARSRLCFDASNSSRSPRSDRQWDKCSYEHYPPVKPISQERLNSFFPPHRPVRDSFVRRRGSVEFFCKPAKPFSKLHRPLASKLAMQFAILND